MQQWMKMGYALGAVALVACTEEPAASMEPPLATTMAGAAAAPPTIPAPTDGPAGPSAPTTPPSTPVLAPGSAPPTSMPPADPTPATDTPGVTPPAGMPPSGMPPMAGMMGAEPPPAGMSGSGTMEPPPEMMSGAPNQALPPVTDYGQAGPFETTRERNTGPDGAYTIFRPDPLGADGFLHSVVTFGPGIATSGESSYTTLLTHLASHGYVAISANSFGFSGPGSPAHVEIMREGLEWVIAKNEEGGSPYEGMIAVDRGVGMGYSLGATASALLASHEAVMTTVAIHGHIQMQGGEPHGPILYLTGNGPSAVGDQVMQVVSGLDTAPGLMALYEGQGHLTVIPDQLAMGKPELVALTAWLRYWVNGDEDAKNHFSGDGCTMCTSDWTLQGNAMWDALDL